MKFANYQINKSLRERARKDTPEDIADRARRIEEANQRRAEALIEIEKLFGKGMK